MCRFRFPSPWTIDLRKDMFCCRKEFSPLVYPNSELTIKLFIICISGMTPSWRGSHHQRPPLTLKTPRRFIARDRNVAHENEQRRAAAAISPTVLLSGSAYRNPSGVAELVRMISFKRTFCGGPW